MNKQEVQKRVLQNGKPLELDKFNWCEKTKTFSSIEENLVIDFNGIGNSTFKTGSCCNFYTGDNSTFKTGSCCNFYTGHGCTFDTGPCCNFYTGDNSTFKTGDNSTFDTGYYCTFKTGDNSTFKTGSCCNFYTGHGCTFKTGHGCTFKTGYYCTFETGSCCNFYTGNNSVVIRRDIYQVIELERGKTTQLYPYEIKGYSINGVCSETMQEVVVADDILSYVLDKKGNVYKVKNYGEENESYLIKDGDIYSHGNTIKEARESLIYKIGNRDKSEYENLTLDSVLTKEEAIKCYRVITGACEKGVKYFVESQENIKDQYTVKEIIELTENNYLNNEFKRFIKEIEK